MKAESLLPARHSYKTKTVALYDVDGRIPNLALMKLSDWFKRRKLKVLLLREGEYIKADEYFAAAVFYCARSQSRIAALRRLYGADIRIGGTGWSLESRLPAEAEDCFPDYSLYDHSAYALGFLTRGCNCGCQFCLVPRKEGRLQLSKDGFDAFVPPGQTNVMLLDNNLLAHPAAADLLRELIVRRYAVNFSQSLEFAALSPALFNLLRQVDSRNARFTRRQFYFSCNSVADAGRFEEKRSLLKELGKDRVTVITMYGYNTRLSEDYRRLLVLRRLGLIPFFQEYWPLKNMPSRQPDDFFDMDLDAVIRLTFRSNGYNWEKYLRWLHRLYFQTFAQYYLPLLRIIYRYNNKKGIERYLRRPHLLTTELYRNKA
jgi:hypothetical protein